MKSGGVHLSPDYCWPCFVWSLFRDVSKRNKFRESLWRVIPKTWRQWWIGSVKELSFLEHITIDEPPSFVDDITVVWNDFCIQLKELKWKN